MKRLLLFVALATIYHTAFCSDLNSSLDMAIIKRIFGEMQNPDLPEEKEEEGQALSAIRYLLDQKDAVCDNPASDPNTSILSTISYEKKLKIYATVLTIREKEPRKVVMVPPLINIDPCLALKIKKT